MVLLPVSINKSLTSDLAEFDISYAVIHYYYIISIIMLLLRVRFFGVPLSNSTLCSTCGDVWLGLVASNLDVIVKETNLNTSWAKYMTRYLSTS